MTDAKTTRDLERRLPQALDAMAPPPPPGLADRVLRLTGGAPQHRSWIGAIAVPALSVAAVVVVAVVIGLQLGSLARDPSSSVGIGPSGSGVATPSASASPPAVTGMTACANPADGYAVSYPSEWYANPAVAAPTGLDPIAPCRFFAEEAFELRPNAGVPGTVAITFQVVPDVRPPNGSLVGDEVRTTVGGRDATVREIETGDGAFMPAGTLVYEYFVALDGGGFLLVSTDSARDGDYAAHKLVIARMMETLQLD